MTWQEILRTIFEICIIPLAGVLTTYLIKYFKKKSDELAARTNNEIEQKYIKMLTDTIVVCVAKTNQTFVESLKNSNTFTLAAQKKAFKETYESIMNILSDDCKEYLSNAFGDLEVYITSKIEAQVYENKK